MKKVKIIFLVVLFVCANSIVIYGRSDKTIKWKCRDLGIVMGQLLEKDPNNIKTSDLDSISYIRIERMEYDGVYHVFINDSHIAKKISATGLEINLLDDFKKFKNLEDLVVYDNNIKSLKPLWKLKKLRSLGIQPSKYMKSIKGIEKLVNLRRVAFTNGEFSNEFSDISPLFKLPKLEEVGIETARGIKDLKPFLNIKNLKELSVTADENIDPTPILEAEHISQVVINGVGLRIDV
ncbi:hypothetical protein [Fusobacterium sp. PH5-44]|uniref:hypothetical protein n=1 Tax=unclassified Fusobacterium TaxID=2648384 RepID=UPI003D1C6531